MTDIGARTSAEPIDMAGSGGGGDSRTLARGGLLNLVGAVLYGVLNFGLVIIITRRLGAAGAGAFLEAVALFSILTTSTLLGADLGLLRFIARYRALDRTLDVRRSLLIALVPVAVLASIAGAVVELMAEPLGRLLSAGSTRADLVVYLRVMAPFIPLGALYQTLEGGSRGFGTMLPAVTIDKIARPLLTPLLVYPVLASGLGATALALAWVGPTALALVPMAWWTMVLVRRLERQVSSAADGSAQRSTVGGRVLAREFWRFSTPRALGGVFQIGIIWLDSLIIGALGSTREAGIYAATTRWLVVGWFAGLAISLAFGPQISFLLARQQRARAQRLYQTATGWLMALSFPAYLTAMIFAPVLLAAFGRGFGSGVTALVILSAAKLFTAACGPVDVVLLMAGRSGLSLFNNGLALVANIVLNIVLVPRYGINGAAVAWTVSLVITNALPLAQVWRYPGLHPFGRGWLTVLGAAVSGVAGVQVLVRLLMGPTVAAMLIAVTASAIVYGALLHRFRDTLDVSALSDGWRARRGRGRSLPVMEAATGR